MKWTTNSNCIVDNECCCPGPTGSSTIWYGGNTGPYVDLSTNTIQQSATRLKEYSFTVGASSEIYLIHYNIVIDGSANNHQITTTLGIYTTADASANISTNLYDNSIGIILTGKNTDKYIGASHGDVGSNDATNISGFATVSNLSLDTHYVTIWAAVKGNNTMTLGTPKVNLVILRIK
jgi:hypothetical protein